MKKHTLTNAGGAIALVLATAGCGAGQSANQAPPTPMVTVATPVVREITDWDEYVGRFEAIQNVDVRPRASGYLQSVHFTDGQYVRKGQLLFVVDPRPAMAQLAQARAQLAEAVATLANARTELARSQKLAEAQAASQEEVQQRSAAVRTGEAQVAAAQANVRARQLDVSFTRVTAPISGRISQRQVDPGNAVVADQTVLTTIVSTNPLHFAFEGSEALLLKYQREGAGVGTGTPVRVRLQDEKDYVHTGTLDFIDNAVDANAGTIRARAIIDNPDGLLRPGLFGSLKLEASKPYPAILVPDTAISADSTRRLVMVVGADGTVQPRPVETGPLVGDLRVIRSGLKRDDKVIIGGAQRARPGQKVDVQAGKIAAPAQIPGQPAAAQTPPKSSDTPDGNSATPAR